MDCTDVSPANGSEASSGSGSAGGGASDVSLWQEPPPPMAALKLRIYRELARQNRRRARRDRLLQLLLLLLALGGWCGWFCGRQGDSGNVCSEEAWLFLPPEYAGSGAPETIPERVEQTAFGVDPVNLTAFWAAFQEEQQLSGVLTLPSTADPSITLEGTMTRRQFLLLLSGLRQLGASRTGGNGPEWTQRLFLGDPNAPVQIRIKF